MRKFNVNVNGNTYVVEIEEIGAGAVAAPAAPTAPVAPTAPTAPVQTAAPAPAAPAAAPAATPAGATEIKAPFPGSVVKIVASAGQAVKKGDVILVIEAMKMENEISAPEDGVVASINVQKGASVATDEVLASIK